MNSLENVREGMDVLDADGERVGTVKFVKMGNPGATTAEGQLAGESPGLMDVIADSFTDRDDLTAEMQERLLRLGYIDVDGAGLGGDFSVAADGVAGVSDDAVRLNTPRSA